MHHISAALLRVAHLALAFQVRENCDETLQFSAQIPNNPWGGGANITCKEKHFEGQNEHKAAV